MTGLGQLVAMAVIALVGCSTCFFGFGLTLYTENHRGSLTKKNTCNSSRLIRKLLLIIQ